MKRGYLLPKGCKDLSDFLKLKQERAEHQTPVPLAPLPPSLATQLQTWIQPVPLPPIKGVIVIPEQTSVLQLAILLNQKPFRIIADLLQINILATGMQQIDFENISIVARKYGFIAKKAT